MAVCSLIWSSHVLNVLVVYVRILLKVSYEPSTLEECPDQDLSLGANDLIVRTAGEVRGSDLTEQTN